MEASTQETLSNSNVAITVEFTGGLELLFSNQRKHILSIASHDEGGKSVNMDYLISYLCNNVMKGGRKDMFIVDDQVRPGILVLINDADWELEGEGSYQLQPKDNILFVSTLHGG
ncbi:Ubiquitin- modifier 1 [Xylographa soralifera]|nr:Ubiquitin- modifier 1 [Xylographa soralifera]